VIGMPAPPQRLTADGAAPLRGEEQRDPSGGTEAARAHTESLPSGAVRPARCNPAMTEHELVEGVRRLRAQGLPPRAIARALGVRPADVAPLVRELAAEAPADALLAGCWVSPGWSRDLIVAPRDGWADVDLGPGGPVGLALVLVARAGRRDDVSVCGYLVDTFCLGVKNAIGPERMRRRDLPGFARRYFAAFPAPALPAPLDLAQHLVHGAVAFAAGLGFKPHPDFAAARGHLGEPDEPCPITFGREGRPCYVQGIADDPRAVVRTLMDRVGRDGFAVAA
jgi:hypothetical protein